jgi:hypothetical protein
VAHECRGAAPDISLIDVLIMNRPSAKDHPGSLAYSLPFAKSGFRVVVFYDRVVQSTIAPSPALLGHVIAHEVGHMLMGTLSHAPDGVMVAHWSQNDMIVMSGRTLRFTASDIEMIDNRWLTQRSTCGSGDVLIAGRRIHSPRN